MKDINVEAMNNAVDIATRESETKLARMESEMEAVREESKALGVLQKINYDNAHNELLKYTTLYQIRESKEYKKGGLTWEQFCEELGEPKRTVNDKLKDIGPLVENFQASLARFSKVPFNKIRYLGRSLWADSAQTDDRNIYIDGVAISLEAENRDEIAAAIDTLIETHKKEQKELKKKLDNSRKNTDRLIKEETKILKHERDALIKEVDRLKPYDITEKDASWSVDLITKMKDMVSGFTAAANKLIMDERLKEDMHLQAKAEQMILLMNRMTGELNRAWDNVFSVYED